MATNGAASQAELWKHIHLQREKVGELLGTLTDAEWETASLCSEWRVREVAAHMVETHLMTPLRFAGRFAASGFRFNTFTGKGVALHEYQTPASLLSQYRESASRSTAPPGPRVTWLAEAVIHGEDIGRPTGRSVAVSPETLVAVADFCRGSTPLLHGKQRTAGLSLRATDVDWVAGSGPLVSGPATSLILAITGRRAALADLTGDGVETLRQRM